MTRNNLCIIWISLKIGGESLGLWNYKFAENIGGAPERNKLVEKPTKGLKFDGKSYLAIDTTNYADLTTSFFFKMKFKPERANGILLFIGDNTSRDYAALEIRNQYLVYSFNLGNYSYNFFIAAPFFTRFYLKVA